MLQEIGQTVDPRFSGARPRLVKCVFDVLRKQLGTLKKASALQIQERIDPVMDAFNTGLKPDGSNTLEPLGGSPKDARTTGKSDGPKSDGPKTRSSVQRGLVKTRTRTARMSGRQEGQHK